MGQRALRQLCQTRDEFVQECCAIAQRLFPLNDTPAVEVVEI